MIDLGPENVVRLANELGVATEFPEERMVPSLVLGAGEVSVLDMAAAYSTFANQGTAITPRMITRVERADGTLVEEFSSDRREVLTADETARVTHTLRGVIEDGTGDRGRHRSARGRQDGDDVEQLRRLVRRLHPEVTTAVWMGYPIPPPMTSVQGETVAGGNIPARIWKRVHGVRPRRHRAERVHRARRHRGRP